MFMHRAGTRSTLRASCHHFLPARHNIPRIGRILIACGRDATDVAITTSFGHCDLVGFRVVTDEVTPAKIAGSPAAIRS